MSELNFCTYFDHNYLPQGLVLYKTLKAFAPQAKLYILALTSECRDFFRTFNLQDIYIVELAELELAEIDLEQAKNNRSAIEYIFTLSPFWIRFLLRSVSDIKMLTYVDADTAFFSEPLAALNRLQTSIGLVGHRLPIRLKNLSCYGDYNVGWNTFINDDASRTCLDWWCEKCLEWCYDRCDGGRFADQGYLNQWPDLFKAAEIPHKGINVAPWNVDTFTFSTREGVVFVDEDPLVFFHFQGMKRFGGCLCDAGLARYGSRMTPLLRTSVFQPYFLELWRTAQKYDLHLWNFARGSSMSSFRALYAGFRHFCRILSTNSFLRIPRHN